MRAALVVNHVGPDLAANLSEIQRMVREAATGGAEVVLCPEAAVTGLINNDDPAHDLPLGQPIPGPVSRALAALAHEQHIWLATGLLERDGNRLYDAAVLFAQDGAIAIKYRRIQPQWHGKRADPVVYCQGNTLAKAATPFGALAFLICGDLFDDDLIRRLRGLAPDWLLFPFAREFRDGSCDQERWDSAERPAYVQRVKLAGVTTLMANYLADATLPDDRSFGGALVVRGDGTIVASLPLGQSGILLVDL